MDVRQSVKTRCLCKYNSQVDDHAETIVQLYLRTVAHAPLNNIGIRTDSTVSDTTPTLIKPIQIYKYEHHCGHDHRQFRFSPGYHF